MSKSPESGRTFRRRKRLTVRAVSALVPMFATLNGLMAISAQAEEACAKLTTVSIQEWTGDIINVVPWVADAKGMFRKHCRQDGGTPWEK